MWKTISETLRSNKLFVFLILCLIGIASTLLVSCQESEKVEEKAEDTVKALAPAEVQKPKPPETVFTHEDIPENIRKKMWGVTISDKSYATFDDLSYLTLTYFGYDGKSHTGNMIVDKELAEEVICIFRELYEARFPIEKMRLPCEYNGVDELSMQDNNTSAFNDRPIEGSGALSYHQKGRAIDINPLVNPYIRFSDKLVLPTTAAEYLDREKDIQGMIKPDSVCVKIFEKYGWTWGGNWTSLKDYQHFEKE